MTMISGNLRRYQSFRR